MAEKKKKQTDNEKIQHSVPEVKSKAKNKNKQTETKPCKKDKRKWKKKKCSSDRTEIPLRIPSHFLRRNHQNTAREGTKAKKSENKGNFSCPCI